MTTKESTISFLVKNNLQKCSCQKNLFLVSSNILSTTLNQIHTFDNYCLWTNISKYLKSNTYKHVFIWIKINTFENEKVTQILYKSLFYRKAVGLTSAELNFNYPIDLFNYIRCLLYEILTYFPPITEFETLDYRHKDFYKIYYNKLQTDISLEEFYKNVNPLYTFNIKACKSIYDCKIKHTLKNCIILSMPYLSTFNIIYNPDITL